MLDQQNSPFAILVAAVILVVGTLGFNNVNATVSSEDALFTVTAEIMDMELAREVRLALAQETTLSGLNIAVRAHDGKVSLSGVVETQYQRDQALHIALAVEGVEVVFNKLALKKQY